MDWRIVQGYFNSELDFFKTSNLDSGSRAEPSTRVKVGLGASGRSFSAVSVIASKESG